jgi:transcription elongation GreA/GreB family factor
MSRAFVKEVDDAGPELPPEHPISTNPNLVTPAGLALIDARLAEIDEGLAREPDEGEAAHLKREQRYWTSRRATAQLTGPPEGAETGFGPKVTVRRDGKAAEVLEIVGEDEADPAAGKLSYVSPLAMALMEAEAGETVEVGPREPPIEVEILEVDNQPAT